MRFRGDDEAAPWRETLSGSNVPMLQCAGAACAVFGAQPASVEQNMRGEYTALLKQDGDWWIGWIEEVPGVNCQERTRDELLESLRETLREALAFNREDAVREAGSGYHEVKLAV